MCISFINLSGGGAESNFSYRLAHDWLSDVCCLVCDRCQVFTSAGLSGGQGANVGVLIDC